MNLPPTPPSQSTPVDDVRIVREQIAAEHRGNMADHRRETNRQFEALAAKLNLKVIPAGPSNNPPHAKTG